MGRCGSVGKKYDNLHYIIGNKLFSLHLGDDYNIHGPLLNPIYKFPVFSLWLSNLKFSLSVSILEICDNFIHETDF